MMIRKRGIPLSIGQCDRKYSVKLECVTFDRSLDKAVLKRRGESPSLSVNLKTYVKNRYVMFGGAFAIVVLMRLDWWKSWRLDFTIAGNTLINQESSERHVLTSPPRRSVQYCKSY